MSYTMDDFKREFLLKHVVDLSPEERMEGMTAEEILSTLPPAFRIKSLTIDELAQALSKEQFEELARCFRQHAQDQDRDAFPKTSDPARGGETAL